MGFAGVGQQNRHIFLGGPAGVIVLFTWSAGDDHALADAHAMVLELLCMGDRRMGAVDIDRFGRLQERDDILQVYVIQ